MQEAGGLVELNLAESDAIVVSWNRKAFSLVMRHASAAVPGERPGLPGSL